MMNRTAFIIGIVLFFCSLSPAAESTRPSVTVEEVAAVMQQHPVVRPGLLIDLEQGKAIRAGIGSDPFLKALADTILEDADRRIGQKPLTRTLTGRRLLSVSREAVTRLLSLGAAYRLTGQDKYVRQAETEMLTIADFSDWNPSHFLDVAEMTAAMAVGYDWFYDRLSEEHRTIIRNAIISKGLEPSLKTDHWSRANHNWNQVCNGGIGLGALAVRDEKPELAAQIIHRALTTIQLPMNEYEPDGAYPEGPGYWSYGTLYNVVLICGLESTLGTDFGLSQRKGFAASADYMLHATGPGGMYFNYADCGHGGGVNPSVFWFAKHYEKPYLIYQQIRELLPDGVTRINPGSGWFFPLMLSWADDKTAVPPQRCWAGRGITPVAMFRSSWTDPDAAYLAVKGGSPSSNHAHMDAGSFVYEADGVRWAMDLGKQDYYQMESRGLNIWDQAQDSQRWQIFRYSNFAHNTLTVNGQLHRVTGDAKLIHFSVEEPNPYAIIDLSSMFEGQLEKALRGATLLPTRQAIIQDELQAGDKPATVRWAMVVPGKAEILSATSARLTEKGKTLWFDIHCPKDTQIKLYSTQPPQEWDEPNPNTTLIGFEVDLQPREKIRMAVLLTPGSSARKQPMPDLKPLESWSE